MSNYERSFEKLEKDMDLQKMSQRAKEFINAETINPDDFSRYDPAMISADKAYVRQMEAEFERDAQPDEREAKQMADVLEAIVLEFGEQGYWFGGEGENEDVTTVKTARYDDIKNGTDIIIEYSQKGEGVSNLGLGIDITYRKDLFSKMERICKEVESGNLTTIRYFYSPKRNMRGEQPGVPRVIVGVSGDHAKELGRLWLERKNKQLSEHPVQVLFLEEIEAQLAASLKIAEKHKHTHAIRAIEDSLTIIQKALNGKKGFIEKNREKIDDYRFRDPVYASILDYTRSIGAR
jgi:hypothetical protein